MEKEDYDSEERKTGERTKTPQGKIEREYAAEEKAFLPGSVTAETWRDDRKNPKKGFTEYMRFIWPYAAIMAIVFFGALVTGYISAANFPSMADALRESFSSRFESLLTMDPFSIMFAIFLNNSFYFCL